MDFRVVETLFFTERLFIWVIDKDELDFNIFLYENREKTRVCFIYRYYSRFLILAFNNMRAKN